MLNRISTRTVWRTTFPATESVTLRSRDDGSDAGSVSYTDYAVAHAKRRPSQAGEQPRGPGYVVSLRRQNWQIWQDALDAVSAPRPKTGDLIVDGDGVSWKVGSVSARLFQNLLDCQAEEVPSSSS